MEFITDNFGLLTSNAEQCDQLKQLVLDLTFKGELTDTTSDDVPGEELLAKIKAEWENLYKKGRFGKPKKFQPLVKEDIPYTLPSKWSWCRLGELGFTQTGTTPSRSKTEYYSDYIPFLGPGDMQNGEIDYSNKGLSKLGLEKGRLIENGLYISDPLTPQIQFYQTPPIRSI